MLYIKRARYKVILKKNSFVTRGCREPPARTFLFCLLTSNVQHQIFFCNSSKLQGCWASVNAAFLKGIFNLPGVRTFRQQFQGDANSHYISPPWKYSIRFPLNLILLQNLYAFLGSWKACFPPYLFFHVLLPDLYPIPNKCCRRQREKPFCKRAKSVCQLTVAN